MTLCPRGCGRPSRRVLSTMNRRLPPLCAVCAVTDNRGVYRMADRSMVTAKQNAARRAQAEAEVEMRYRLALAAIKRGRVA